MYELLFTKVALKNIEVYCRRDLLMCRQIEETLSKLSYVPNHPGLRTHKVYTKKYGEHFSSRVTGDIRIFWNYYSEGVIRIYTLGDHSEYK